MEPIVSAIQRIVTASKVRRKAKVSWKKRTTARRKRSFILCVLLLCQHVMPCVNVCFRKLVIKQSVKRFD